MRISKGNVKNINKRILAGAIAFSFFTIKLFDYKVIKKIKYNYAKLEYSQVELDDVKLKEYIIIPEKTELNFSSEYEILKNKYNKKQKTKVLKRGI